MNRGPLLACALLMLLSPSGGAEAQTAIWFRHPDSGISFAYGPHWQPAQAAESATAQVVNWLGRTGGLVATCYLQTYSGTQLAGLPTDQLHQNAAALTDVFMQNMSIRYSRSELLSSETSFVDGQPVIFTVRDGWMVNLGKETGIRAWSIFTTWKEREVSLECASPIPHQFPGNEVVETVEAEVMKVLRTLHFERAP